MNPNIFGEKSNWLHLFMLSVCLLLTKSIFSQYSIIPPKPDDPNGLREILMRPVSKEDWKDKRNGQIEKAAALLKYAKFDAADARQIALSELASSDPNIDCSGLLFLEDKELPYLSDIFRKNLKSETNWSYLKCIERYGSSDLLADIIQYYEPMKGQLVCDLAEGSLGFIVKHDRSTGLKLVEEAVNLRGNTGCYKDVMLVVLKNYPGEDVLELALKYVNDENEEVSIDAADLASRQPGGKIKLKEALDGNRVNESERARKYVQEYIDRVIK